VGCSAVVNCGFPKRLKGSPREVSGVKGEAIQYYNFGHGILLTMRKVDHPHDNTKRAPHFGSAR